MSENSRACDIIINLIKVHIIEGRSLFIGVTGEVRGSATKQSLMQLTWLRSSMQQSCM